MSIRSRIAVLIVATQSVAAAVGAPCAIAARSAHAACSRWIDVEWRFQRGQCAELAAKAGRGACRREARTERDRLLQAFDEGRQIVLDGGWPAWSVMVLTHEPGSPFYADMACDYSFANSRY